MSEQAKPQWELQYAGIGSSAGTIYDFAGFGITRGCFAFGSPTRYLPLSPGAAAALRPEAARVDWDRALERSTLAFDDVSYNFVTTNCHAYVQWVLESVALGGPQRWGTVKLVRLRSLAHSRTRAGLLASRCLRVLLGSSSMPWVSGVCGMGRWALM